MIQDPLTLYKLIILYMLNRVSFSLTVAQISDFLLEREYTGYMSLNQAISELMDASMIKSHTVRNRTYLDITKEGKDTLNFFGNRISDAIKEEIDTFFREKEYNLRNEAAVMADYYKSTTGEYEARLIAKEKDIPLVELTLSVPTKELASEICDNWQKKNQEIYQYLIQELF